MESRVALIGVIVENPDAVEKLNDLLHQNAAYIIGRMGIPYPKRGISIISISMDAPADVISSLSGKLGMLSGVSTKTIYSRAAEKKEEV
jgi:putative iron-only hydrogenase system regulator